MTIREKIGDICDNFEDFALGKTPSGGNGSGNEEEAELGGAFTQRIEKDFAKKSERKIREKRRKVKKRQISKKAEKNLCQVKHFIN